jgi:hypothetical protein
LGKELFIVKTGWHTLIPSTLNEVELEDSNILGCYPVLGLHDPEDGGTKLFEALVNISTSR